MKVSKEEVARHREQIVEAAAQLFRERGFDGIGVADLMEEAGLTHGGFYGHFSSKDELIAEASRHALTHSLALLTETAETASRNPLLAVVTAYLAPQHRDDPGAGCLLAALGSDAARQGRAVRRTVTDHARAAVELFEKLVPGKSRAVRKQKAIGIYATLIGAMVMARAVDDRKLSQEILDAGRVSAKDQARGF